MRGGNQAVFAVSDQILPVCRAERLLAEGTLFGIIILQQRPLKRLFMRCFCHINRLHSIRIQFRVEHAGGDRAGRWIKILHLFRPDMIFL